MIKNWSMCPVLPFSIFFFFLVDFKGGEIKLCSPSVIWHLEKNKNHCLTSNEMVSSIWVPNLQSWYIFKGTADNALYRNGQITQNTEHHRSIKIQNRWRKHFKGIWGGEVLWNIRKENSAKLNRTIESINNPRIIVFKTK